MIENWKQISWELYFCFFRLLSATSRKWISVLLIPNERCLLLDHIGPAKGRYVKKQHCGSGSAHFGRLTGSWIWIRIKLKVKIPIRIKYRCNFPVVKKWISYAAINIHLFTYLLFKFKVKIRICIRVKDRSGSVSKWCVSATLLERIVAMAGMAIEIVTIAIGLNETSLVIVL